MRVPLTAPVVLIVAVLIWLAVTSFENWLKSSFVGVVVVIPGRKSSNAVTSTPRSSNHARHRGGRGLAGPGGREPGPELAGRDSGGVRVDITLPSKLVTGITCANVHTFPVLGTYQLARPKRGCGWGSIGCGQEPLVAPPPPPTPGGASMIEP